MRDQFSITGHYYTEQPFTFRSYLNIRRNGTLLKTPDLMVVMMNPGSSKPVDGNHDGRIETPAIPDNTQDQVMHVMESCAFDYARVLNLSDYREATSGDFYRQIGPMTTAGIAHSIFDPARAAELAILFQPGVPVICAWGVNQKLHELAAQAQAFLTNATCFGMQKPGCDFGFYHPLPRRDAQRKQREWREELTRQLLNR